VAEEGEKLVPVHVCYRREEAEVCCSMLRAYGIPVQLADREMASVQGELVVTPNGFYIWAPESFRSTILELLKRP
jgi:N-dimethylarginine dimethylaminohydrolase